MICQSVIKLTENFYRGPLTIQKILNFSFLRFYYNTWKSLMHIKPINISSLSYVNAHRLNIYAAKNRIWKTENVQSNHKQIWTMFFTKKFTSIINFLFKKINKANHLQNFELVFLIYLLMHWYLCNRLITNCQRPLKEIFHKKIFDRLINTNSKWCQWTFDNIYGNKTFDNILLKHQITHIQSEHFIKNQYFNLSPYKNTLFMI